MTVSKGTPTQILTNGTAAGGSGSTSGAMVIDTNAVIALAIEILLTYGSATAAAPTVYLYGSYDGTHWDSDPFDQFTMRLATSTTVSQTFNTIPGPRYINVVVKNNDATSGSTHDITAVNIYTHAQSVS